MPALLANDTMDLASPSPGFLTIRKRWIVDLDVVRIELRR
jgi:hypothetical protein